MQRHQDGEGQQLRCDSHSFFLSQKPQGDLQTLNSTWNFQRFHKYWKIGIPSVEDTIPADVRQWGWVSAERLGEKQVRTSPAGDCRRGNNTSAGTTRRTQCTPACPTTTSGRRSRRCLRHTNSGPSNQNQGGKHATWILGKTRHKKTPKRQNKQVQQNKKSIYKIKKIINKYKYKFYQYIK